MGLFICRICNETLGDNFVHQCDQTKVEAHIEKLQNEAHVAERRLNDIRNAVFMVLQELPSLEGEKVEVNGEWLRRLWGAGDCRWWEAKSADEFLVRWLATQKILCEAFDLFRSERKGTRPKSTLEQLRALRKACVDAKNLMYNDSSSFNVTADDIVAGTISW